MHMLFCFTSATWPAEVQRLADMYMSDPIHIFVGTLDLAVGVFVLYILKLAQLWIYLFAMLS